MSSKCSLVNNTMYNRDRIDLLELNGANDRGLKVRDVSPLDSDLNLRKTKHCDENSTTTRFQEIKLISKKSKDFTETMIDPNQYAKNPMWGEITIRAEYNKKRECIKMDCLHIRPNKIYYKLKRDHFFICKINCKGTHSEWNSGLFNFIKGHPKVSSFTFDSLLIQNLNKSNFEFKVYRMKMSVGHRIIGQGKIDFQEIKHLNGKSKRLMLKALYHDKQQKIKPPKNRPVKTVPNSNATNHDPGKPLDVTDADEDLELKFCQFQLVTPEILVGLGYNQTTNVLTVDVKKCVNLFEMWGINSFSLETYVKVILNPEKSEGSTDHYHQTENPEFKQRFNFPLFSPNMTKGEISFHVINYRTDKLQFCATIDRETDVHWTEMIMMSPTIIYQWHELYRYSKKRK